MGSRSENVLTSTKIGGFLIKVCDSSHNTYIKVTPNLDCIEWHTNNNKFLSLFRELEILLNSVIFGHIVVFSETFLQSASTKVRLYCKTDILSRVIPLTVILLFFEIPLHIVLFVLYEPALTVTKVWNLPTLRSCARHPLF